MSSSYRIELDKWLADLDVTASRVLDIGGAQKPVKGRTRTWQVEDYSIADLPSPHADSPKPDVALDLNNPVSLAFGDRKYDMIFCLEVFDYIYNPVLALNIISHILKIGGIAYVSFPSVYPLHQPIEDDALRYMPGGVKKMAEFAGLEIVELTYRRPETNLFEQFYRAERMRAAKHQDHNFTGFIAEFRKC